MTRMAHVDAGLKEMGSLRGSRPNLQPGVSGFIRRPLSAWGQGLGARVLGPLGLGLLGRIRHHRQLRRTWIVWSGWVPGGIDDGGTGG